MGQLLIADAIVVAQPGEEPGRSPDSVAPVVDGRLSRDEFYAKLSGPDEAALKKALWTVYWRGAAPVRERIESILDPPRAQARARAASLPPDPSLVLDEVTEFAALARSGSYLAGDRRVSRQERSRWRHTFRRLSTQAQDALRDEDVQTAAAALIAMIDLACETGGLEYFRSEDPLEAAGFVVSDAVAALWSRMRHVQGPAAFTEDAAGQLLRWESRYGWTRRGDGRVSAREASLASVLAGMLTTPDMWADAAGHYLNALDRVADRGNDRTSGRRGCQVRAKNLSEWHALLVERLVGSDHEDLLDRLATHSALAGPDLTFMQARLARQRGEVELAGTLAQRSLKALPGDPEFREFAREIGADRPLGGT